MSQNTPPNNNPERFGHLRTALGGPAALRAPTPKSEPTTQCLMVCHFSKVDCCSELTNPDH
eukprot:1544612-Amphidinium_carterae.2